MPKARIAIALATLFVAMLSVAQSSSGSQSRLTHSQASTRQQRAAKQYQLADLRQAVQFYRQATWHRQDSAGLPRTPTSFAERRVSGKEYLGWMARRWKSRALNTRRYVLAHPWLRLVRATYRYRQCIITGESRTSGMYRAKNPRSTASGAYQFLDGTWQSEVRSFEHYYRRNITSATRAIDAPPTVQDAIAAYAIKADHGQPWAECRGLPILR